MTATIIVGAIWCGGSFALGLMLGEWMESTKRDRW